MLLVQVQDVPGLVERLLGFLDIGKDFVTAETIVQVKDLARKYPDIAEVCVGSVSNISLEVGSTGSTPHPASPSPSLSLMYIPMHNLCLSCLYHTMSRKCGAPAGDILSAIASIMFQHAVGISFVYCALV